MKILLYKVNPVSGGEEAELYVELTSGENSERSKFTVSAEMFFELGFSVDHTREQELSREKYEEITLLAGRHAAVKRGLSILSFGDNTKKGLASKLRTKGFSLFVGVGVGYGMLISDFQKIEHIKDVDKLGCFCVMPRVGFEIAHHVRATLYYKQLKTGQNHFGANLGIVLGGGKKKVKAVATE